MYDRDVEDDPQPRSNIPAVCSGVELNYSYIVELR